MSEVPGSGIWRRFKPEQIRQLRLIGRRRLIALGMQPWQVTDREVDKWLESRMEETLEKYVKLARDRKI